MHVLVDYVIFWLRAPMKYFCFQELRKSPCMRLKIQMERRTWRCLYSARGYKHVWYSWRRSLIIWNKTVNCHIGCLSNVTGMFSLSPKYHRVLDHFAIRRYFRFNFVLYCIPSSENTALSKQQVRLNNCTYWCIVPQSRLDIADFNNAHMLRTNVT